MAPPKRRRKLQAESFDAAPAAVDEPSTTDVPDEALDKAIGLLGSTEEGPAGEPSSAREGASSTPTGEAETTTASSASGATGDREASLRSIHARIIVHEAVLLASGSGLLPLPVLDAMALTAVQIRMTRKLAMHYGVPFSVRRGKWLIRSLGGYLVNTTTLVSVGGFSKLVPGIGTLLGVASMTLVAGAFTHALGGVLIRHFEKDGNLESFDPTQHQSEFEQEYASASSRSPGQRA